MNHRYILIGGACDGQRLQDKDPRHNDHGFLILPDMAQAHAFMMGDADPVATTIDQHEYVIVASEHYRDHDEELAIYYAVPARFAPSDAMLFLCRQVTRLQNFSHEMVDMFGKHPGSMVAEKLKKYGLKTL